MIPTWRSWMRSPSLRSWGGAAAGLLVLGVGAALAQSPIIIQRGPKPAPAAPTNDALPVPVSPSLAPGPVVPIISTVAPASSSMPAPLLQLAPPPAQEPVFPVQPVTPAAKLPDLPEPSTPPAAPQSQALPPFPNTPALPVEGRGWTITKPAPVPPPLPVGMPPVPAAIRADNASATLPEVKPALNPDAKVEIKAAVPPPPLKAPEAKIPDVEPVATPSTNVPPLPTPVLPPAPRPAAEPTPGATPVASAEVQKEYGQFVTSMIDPQTTLDLVAGRPRVLVLADAPKRVQVGDEKIVGFEQLPPNELVLTPKSVGTTVLNLWFPDPADDSKNKILSYLVRVFPDPQAKERLRGSCQTLADEINRAFPESRVTLFPVGDKLAVSGYARDAAQATQILQIARDHAPPDFRPPENVKPAAHLLSQTAGPNVVDLLRVPGEQQIQLRVTVAEVNRAAARSIGLSCGGDERHHGVTIFANRTAQMDGLASVSGANVPVFLDNGQIGLAIHALRCLNLAKSLAEPNLVALNGQRAEFKAGGEFPVPVFACDGRSGVEFHPYGVHLCFTPFVMDHDRIRLVVQAEVSTKDLAATANVGGTAVPGLNSRTFQTTVELGEGQTLAVAGLVQNSFAAGTERTPGLSCLPGVGRLFESEAASAAEQELIVLITPELVRPTDCRDAAPGGDLIERGDVEFYVLGRLQGQHRADCRGPAGLDPAQRKRLCHCENVFLAGPQGYSDGR
jgi:pilus assembly protein CpaC